MPSLDPAIETIRRATLLTRPQPGLPAVHRMLDAGTYQHAIFALQCNHVRTCSTRILTTGLLRFRPGDAEPIKRLKREMSVALSEEDYATAARIRDHPYIQLYLSINEALRKKDVEVRMCGMSGVHLCERMCRPVSMQSTCSPWTLSVSVCTASSRVYYGFEAACRQHASCQRSSQRL